MQREFLSRENMRLLLVCSITLRNIIRWIFPRRFLHNKEFDDEKLAFDINVNAGRYFHGSVVRLRRWRQRLVHDSKYR